MKKYTCRFDLEITMKTIILAAVAGLALTATAASAAPRQQARTQKSPQVTAHEQSTSRNSDEGFWNKQNAYKPHWRNHYTN
jgi:hypothetical protein